MDKPVEHTASPFHAGEQSIQIREGKREAIESFGRRAIRPYMPEQHREFYQHIPFLVVGSVDNDGDPWASLLTGKKGFISSNSPTHLGLNGTPFDGDPLALALQRVDAPLGLLGIELSTRRRNRVNTHVVSFSKGLTHLAVDQSFGNCPQYIQTRDIHFHRKPDVKAENQQNIEFTSFDNKGLALIESADTFFVSSYITAELQPKIEGVDVSHRGGMPGFVKVENNTLTIPDFAGNYHFNTLGNFLMNPKAGLIFPDFESGDLLMLTGSVEILWEDHPEVSSFQGAQRAWRFTLKKGIWLNNALPFKTQFNGFSPNSKMAGTWAQAKQNLELEATKNTWQPMRVIKKVTESNNVTSFYLKHANGKGLLPFEAGQFITLRFENSQNDKQQTRTYTLTSSPADDCYRISIKRENDGKISTLMHQKIAVGDIIPIKYPTGNFYLDTAQKRPAVLLAAGIGITPMISMAQHVLNEGLRTRHTRSLTILHSSKSTDERAFYQQFKELEARSNGHIRYLSFVTQPGSKDTPGKDFNGNSRIDIDVLKQVLSFQDYDFYLCGPSSFMQSLYDQLIEFGIQDKRIFGEAFGPASFNREPQNSESKTNLEAHSSVIKFTKSDFEQGWNSGDKTLLEVAESHGLQPDFGCRNGACGSCAVKIRSGEVTYRQTPSATVDAEEVLICCAVPAKGTQTLEIEL